MLCDVFQVCWDFNRKYAGSYSLEWVTLVDKYGTWRFTTALEIMCFGPQQNVVGMNLVQYKDLLCYMCPFGTVVSSLSLTQEILGSNPAIFLLIFNFLSLNSADSMKTFRENSNKPCLPKKVTNNKTIQNESLNKSKHGNWRYYQKVLIFYLFCQVIRFIWI